MDVRGGVGGGWESGEEELDLRVTSCDFRSCIWEWRTRISEIEGRLVAKRSVRRESDSARRRSKSEIEGLDIAHRKGVKGREQQIDRETRLAKGSSKKRKKKTPERGVEG